MTAMRRYPALSVLAWMVAVITLASACSQPAVFQGTELEAADPAPSFQFRDQFGNSVSSDDFAGKVVVLTFLYTNCPDICPIITETLRRAHEQLGENTERVQFVAISVDPARDTVEQVHRYSEEKEMLHKWAFLVGEEEELATTWAAYYVAADRIEQEGSKDALETLSEQETPHDEDVEYLVTHTDAVYLIDQEGRLRILFTNLSLDPGPLVHDIRLLL